MSQDDAKPSLQVGLAVEPENLYIVRKSDHDAVLEVLLRCEYCNVLCPRQMGKTSLIIRVREQLEQNGRARTAQVDLGAPLGTAIPSDTWYVGLLREVTKELGISFDADLWWKSHCSATPNQRLIEFFHDEVAAKSTLPVVVFIDEIDMTLPLPFSDDFFVAIRAIANDRARLPDFKKITFCLVGVASPNDLIKDRRTTPYNVGRTIELRDFDPDVDVLNTLYSAVSDDPHLGEALVRNVLEWTGGHPFLTVKLCHELATRQADSVAAVKQLIDEWFPDLQSAMERADSPAHFETVLRFVKERVELDDRLTALSLYRRIYRRRRELDRTTPAHIALKLSGLVKRDKHGRLIVRNEIYRRVFTARWATKTMPPMARAVRTTLRWTFAVAALLLLTAGIWSEGIYPYQLTMRLRAAIAEDRYTFDTYQFLRSIPFYSSKADQLWAGFFDQRATIAEGEEKRDEALLWRLKAMSIHPTDRRRRAAALLIGVDYTKLKRTIHFSKGESVALSGDGHLAGVAGEGIVRLWDTRKGRVIREIPSLHNRINGVQLCGDGSVLASVDDKNVRLWRTATGATFGECLTCDNAVEALSLNRDGSVAGTLSHTLVLQLLRTETGELLGKPLDHGSVANVLSGDGRVFAMGQGDKEHTVQIWQTETGKPIGKPLVCQSHLYTDNSIALNGDGSVLAAANGTTVQVWRTENGEPIGEPRHCGDSVVCVAISADGNLMATGSNTGTVQVWLLKTGFPIGEPLNLGTSVNRVAVANDGYVVAAGDLVVRAWKTTTNEPVNITYSDSETAKSIILSGNGRVLAVRNREGNLQLWDTETGKPIGKPLELGTDVQWVKLSGDGKLAGVLKGDGKLRLWRVEGWMPIGKPWQFPVHAGTVALSDNGVVASGGLYGTVDLWRIESGERFGKELHFETENTYALAFSRDGSIVAAGSERGVVQLWRTESGEPLGERLELKSSVLSIAFSPESHALLIATERWIHIMHAGDAKPAASRLYRQMPMYDSAWKFLDERGNRVQMVNRFRDGKPSFATVQFDQPDPEPVQDNPTELLCDWEKRLGLSFDRNGQIMLNTTDAKMTRP